MNIEALKNIKTVIVALVLSLLIMPFFFSTPVHAESLAVNNGVTHIDENTTSNSDTSAIDSAQLPSTSVKEVSDLVEKKTYDVVTIMQVFAKPFASVIFIFSAILTLFGAITKGGMSKGLIGMFIAGMMYTAVMYAPEIVHFFSTWLSMK